MSNYAVLRYEPDGEDAYMSVREEGDWVEYKAFKALQTELDDIKETYKNIVEKKCAEDKKEIEALKATIKEQSDTINKLVAAVVLAEKQAQVVDAVRLCYCWLSTIRDENIFSVGLKDHAAFLLAAYDRMRELEKKEPTT